MVRLTRCHLSIGCPEALDDQPDSVLSQSKAAQRVIQHAESQLALAHKRHAHALALQVGQLAIPVRPHHGVDPWVHPPGEFEDAPGLKAVGCGDDQQPGVLDMRGFQHARCCGITPDYRKALRSELLCAPAVTLDNDERQILLVERPTDWPANATIPDDDRVAPPLRGVRTGARARYWVSRLLHPRQ